jgi:hypothetical protein
MSKKVDCKNTKAKARNTGRAIEPALLLAALSIAAITAGIQYQSANAQYGYGYTTTTNNSTSQTPNVSKEILQKCSQLGIPAGQCSENAILEVERVMMSGGGSGKPLVATEGTQMIEMVGIIGAIFGGVAAAFFVKGRHRGERVTA